jgi:hypothetical protein
MPSWNQLWLPIHCGILAISWQDFLPYLPYLPSLPSKFVHNTEHCCTVQNYPCGSFLSWGGPVGREGIIVYDIVWMGCPRRTPWTSCVHLCAFVSYRRLSPPFQFSLSAATLVYLSQWLWQNPCTGLLYPFLYSMVSRDFNTILAWIGKFPMEK